MHTSTISHIPATPFVVVSLDYLVICDNNPVAAGLLRLFEYWHQCALEIRDRNPDMSQDLWIEKTGKALAEQCMGIWSRTKIVRGLQLLISKGFLDSRHNQEDKRRRDKQYLFLSRQVQSAVNAITEDVIKTVAGDKYSIRPDTASFLADHDTTPLPPPVTAPAPNPQYSPPVTAPAPNPQYSPPVTAPAPNPQYSPPVVPHPEGTAPSVVDQGVANPADAPEGVKQSLQDEEQFLNSILQVGEVRGQTQYLSGATKMQFRYQAPLYPWEAKRSRARKDFAQWVAVFKLPYGKNDSMHPVVKANCHIAKLVKTRDGLIILSQYYREWANSKFFGRELDPQIVANPANHKLLHRQVIMADASDTNALEDLKQQYGLR